MSVAREALNPDEPVTRAEFEALVAGINASNEDAFARLCAAINAALKDVRVSDERLLDTLGRAQLNIVQPVSLAARMVRKTVERDEQGRIAAVTEEAATS